MALFVPLAVYRSGGLAQVNLDRVDYIRQVSDGVSAIFFDNNKLEVTESIPRIIEIMGDANRNR
jgi:hypothetical protein